MNEVIGERLADAAIGAAMSGGIVSGVATTAGTALIAGLATTAALIVPAVAICAAVEHFFPDTVD